MATFFEQLREKTNLKQEMEKDGLKLISQGSSRYKACCPFHSETHPSLVLYEDTDSYYCFGCHASGDIVQYVAERNGISRKEAIEILAAEYGISLDFRQKQDDFKKIKDAEELLSLFSSYYQKTFKALPSEHPAKMEVLRRKLPLSDAYGYAPKNQEKFIKTLENKGYSLPLMWELGLLKDHTLYPFFSDRLTFTFENLAKNPIGFTARALSEEDMTRKFINSQGSFLFKKNDILYYEARARKEIKEKHEVFVVEGPFDLEALRKIGIYNVVATCGTAFTELHAKRLLRASENGKIIFLFDGDTAGKKAVSSVFKKFPALHAYASVILLPDGLDPCDYLKTHESLPPSLWICDFLFQQMEEKVKNYKFDEKVRASYAAYDKFLSLIEEPAIYQHFSHKISLWAGVENPGEMKKQKKEPPKEEKNDLLLSFLAYFRSNKMYQESLFKEKDVLTLSNETKGLIQEYAEKTVIEQFNDPEQAQKVFSLKPVTASSELSFLSRCHYFIRLLEKEEKTKTVVDLFRKVQKEREK